MSTGRAEGPTRKFHRYSWAFPLLAAPEFESLVASVARDGLLEPIVLHADEVLDGRNRYRACVEAGVAPRFVEFDGDDAAARRFVWARNVERRMLSAGEKLAARKTLFPAEFETGDRPGPKSGTSARTRTNEEIGAEAGVSPRTVKQYRAVETHVRPVAPELADAVDRGDISVKAGATLAKTAKDAPDALREAAPDIVAGKVRAGDVAKTVAGRGGAAAQEDTRWQEAPPDNWVGESVAVGAALRAATDALRAAAHGLATLARSHPAAGPRALEGQRVAAAAAKLLDRCVEQGWAE